MIKNVISRPSATAPERVQQHQLLMADQQSRQALDGNADGNMDSQRQADTVPDSRKLLLKRAELAIRYT